MDERLEQIQKKGRCHDRKSKQDEPIRLGCDRLVSDFLDAVETRDIGQVVDFLADDVDMRVNNAPSIEGKNAVVEQLRTQWQHIRGVSHEVLNILGSDTGSVSEALHHYDRHDGRQITACMAVFTERSADGLVASIRIRSDALPVLVDAPGRKAEEIG